LAPEGPRNLAQGGARYERNLGISIATALQPPKGAAETTQEE